MSQTDNDDWQSQAACRGMDPNLWYPLGGDHGRKAKAICAQCQVCERCLQWARDNGETQGIWGGMSFHERVGITRRRRELPECGTITMYGRGCRCEPCRQAKSVYSKAKRGINAGRMDTPHGTNNGYLYYGCRCALCRRANYEYDNARRTG